MKLKTHSGAKKRVKITATGKFKVAKSAQRHLLVKKSKKAKRGSRRGVDAPASLIKNLKKMLPNG